MICYKKQLKYGPEFNIHIYIYFILWQVNYSLRETEWPSIRKRILLWPFCLDILCFLVWTFSPTFLFAFLGWFLAVRCGKWVWYCSSPDGCSSALPTVPPRSALQRTDAVLDPALSYPQIAKLSEASEITLPTTPFASTPLSTQSHTSSTSLGSFPSQCLDLTLFSTLFSMLFPICMSYHRFGTPLTSPSLPWHVSWSLSALKSLPTSANTPEKQKTCLFSRGVPFIILHLLVTSTKPAGHSSVVHVLEEDRKTQLLPQRISSLSQIIIFLDHTANQSIPDPSLVQILQLPAGGTCHSIKREHFNEVVASQFPFWSTAVQLKTCCFISQPQLPHSYTKLTY